MKRLLQRTLTLLLALVLLMLPFGSLGSTAAAQGLSKQVIPVLISASRGTTTSETKSLGDYNALVAFLDVTANTGTNPTLDVVVYDAPTSSGPWFSLITFTQVTGSTSNQAIAATRAPLPYVRAVGTVGGTSTPKFTYTLNFMAYRSGAVSVSSSLGGALAGTQLTLNGASGESSVVKYATELVTLSTSGATTDTSANLLPANSFILGVSWIVTTAVAGVDATALQVGDGTTAARFGSGGTYTAGVTGVGLSHLKGGISTDATGPVQVSAAKLRITLSGGSDQTPSAGAVRVTVAYIQFTSPTS